MDNQSKIELVDDTQVPNEDFKKNVAIPYFKDIYKDLVQQSDNKSKGINKVSILTYSQLPGIIGERFFAVLDLNADGYVDLKEFVHGFFKVYYSNLETKIKLAFDIYDFDKDGYVKKEDARLILSHVPIDKTMSAHHIQAEGQFTSQGGGNEVFLDRIQTQEEIVIFIDKVFGDRTKISLEEFQQINENVSSEMFLTIVILLQSSLPCSENFYRYKKNYEQFVQVPQFGNHLTVDTSKQVAGNDGRRKSIASPTLVSKFSPINTLVRNNLTVNTGILKKYSLNKEQQEVTDQIMAEADQPEEDKTNSIPISQFKSNKLSHIDKKHRAEDFEKIKDTGDMEYSMQDAIRLPNKASSQLKQVGENNVQIKGPDEIMSPTLYFQGNNSGGGRLENFFNQDDRNSVQIEGEMIRKATETKLKKYWYCLLGKELYVYKKKTDDKHKGMHNLVGVFIVDEALEHLDAQTVLYPFKLIFPPNKARTYYLISQEEKERWISAIKKVIGYSTLADYYEIREPLGKGKFGLVKAAVHKKTGKSVAVKIMSKKEMTVSDVELQRREIEILKMCQHPYIIRLLDIFENQDYIYIVMENLSGGDLFTYLEKRKFTIPEQRAKVIAHQIATALYYLHSFGVAHRDLKPENILMESPTENADLKIVDFGLSKIIGPNETSLDPFGTLSYVAPEVLLQKPYGKEVDLWSLGIIIYLMLARVLPFDDEDDREIARQTIYDSPDFNFHPWDKVSKEGKDLCKKLLEKNRHKRPSLEDVLNHPWFGDFKDIHKMRQGADGRSMFMAYTITEPNSPKIKEEIEKYAKA